MYCTFTQGRRVEVLQWVLHHEKCSYSVRWLHLAGCMQGSGGQQNSLVVVHSGALTQEALWSVVHQWMQWWHLSLSSQLMAGPTNM